VEKCLIFGDFYKIVDDDDDLHHFHPSISPLTIFNLICIHPSFHHHHLFFYRFAHPHRGFPIWASHFQPTTFPPENGQFPIWT
jgi:hypothetical protein